VGCPNEIRLLHLPFPAQEGVHPLVGKPGVADDSAAEGGGARRLAVFRDLQLDGDRGPLDVGLERTDVVR
jgi:hypothetical protein